MRTRSCALLAAAVLSYPPLASAELIPATDEARVTRTGPWRSHAFRRASSGHLFTEAGGAALELTFHGTGIVVTLDGHGLPFARLGQPHLGALAVEIDGRPAATVLPQIEDRDVVLARGLPPGRHALRLTHRAAGGRAGCRIAGFRVLNGGEGELSLVVHGEANRFLTDVRAILSKNGRPVRNGLYRSWMTGLCRMAALPAGAGYELRLIASSWETHLIRDISIAPGKETALPPVYLRRSAGAVIDGVQYPRTGWPAIRRAGETFPARFTLGEAEVRSVELRRESGPAAISRRVRFTENKAAAYDGKAEGTVLLPDGVPPGLYDLVFHLAAAGAAIERRSPRSVHVVAEFPRDPVFVTFGHMDTWGQEQAEYLERLADISNLLGADAVLVSNAVNAAYVSGALSRLRVPYVITFGNHRVGGHEEWYGNAVNLVDFGPRLSILNFSPPWHGDLSHAYALLQSREKVPCKIVNAFEHDAPVESMLDRYGITFLHEAHGPPPKVATMGRTPTQRAGKVNSESFRVVRFEGCRPVSFTYAGDPQAPIPLPRHQPWPIAVTWSPANDGTHRTVEAAVRNDWKQAFPASRLVFVVPSGDYQAKGGIIETAVMSDDRRFVELSVRFDLSAEATTRVTVMPR